MGLQGLSEVTGCSDLFASGQLWTPGHVCTAGPYREDALRVWKLMHERPPFRISREDR